jgi:hypothetical protein
LPLRLAVAQPVSSALERDRLGLVDARDVQRRRVLPEVPDELLGRELPLLATPAAASEFPAVVHDANPVMAIRRQLRETSPAAHTYSVPLQVPFDTAQA